MMSDLKNFIHLRVHSAYSLAEGALPVKQLVKTAAKEGMPALGVTDRNNLFGALEFSQTMAGEGLQPVIGCTVSFRFETIAEDDDQASGLKGATGKTAPVSAKQGDLVLIVKNETGYDNLLKIISYAYLADNGLDEPMVTCSTLEKYSDGLIILTGGPDGVIDVALNEGQGERARAMLERLKSIAPDHLYVELQRHGLASEKQVEPQLVELAYDMDLPLVATNQCYFPTPDDYEAHDALICIAEGTYVVVEERRRLTPEHYFKSVDEMIALFKDLPEAIENTSIIAKRCSYRPLLRDPILPRFGDGEGEEVTNEQQEEIEAKELERQAREGLKKRLEVDGISKGYEEQDYWDRLDFELGIITRMKFPGYFLIVSDFIKWSKNKDIPVGPGRGSGAGSVVAWVLSITDLDPLRFGLLFERFLNPERVSMPDFDIDFCQDRRDEVIGYVQDKYGADRVAQIITFGKLQAKAVIRDVGRVLQMPYGQVDRLSKLIPNTIGISLAEAMEEEPKIEEAAQEEPVVRNLLNIAGRLEGLYRHASTHAAGVVIGDRSLDELVPLYRDPRSDIPVTQFNMKWVEPAGLVKFDFLGLKTLTVIQKALQFIKEGGGHVDFTGDPLDDPASYELLARGDTIGVFQLESTGMRESLKALKPDRFEDIIAMVSLYRPGPMDNIPTYIERKFGREEVVYLDDKLAPILDETYGVIIYQEQVMQIAQELAGYSLGEADLLRRAMGKKIAAEMDKQRPSFVNGAFERGVSKKNGEVIFDLLAKFASYGFNKSHAAAYALLAYQTAYLKANYPVEFMAAIMTLDQGNTDKVKLFFEETRAMKIEILPPSINKSTAEFRPENGGIRYSLAALKNVGAEAMEQLCLERDEKGPFKDLADFANRVDPKLINKRTLEMLAAADAFAEFKLERAMVYGNVDLIMASANRAANDQNSGQTSLFGGEDVTPELKLRDVKLWVPREILNKEQDAVGFYLSGHPLDEYSELLSHFRVETYNDFVARVEVLKQESRDKKAAEPIEPPEPSNSSLSLEEQVERNKKREAVKAKDNLIPFRRGERRPDNGIPGTLAGVVAYLQERRSKKGNKFAFAAFSDAAAQFEMVMFAETLEAQRELLQPGTVVLLKVSADPESDSLRLRLLSAEALDQAAGRIQKGVQLTINKETAFPDIAERLSIGGNGRLRLVLRLENMDKDVVVTIPRGIDTSPRQTSALKVLPGVCELKDI
jgi:DNA polymerase III subunit alpha